MHFVAPKGAVIAMARVMAKELGVDKIRANVLAMGFTLTDARNDLMDDLKTTGLAGHLLCAMPNQKILSTARYTSLQICHAS